MTRLEKVENANRSVKYELARIRKDVDDLATFAIRQGFGKEVIDSYSSVLNTFESAENVFEYFTNNLKWSIEKENNKKKK